MTTEQHLKLKLTLGYIFLITVFTLSILYILREVKNMNSSKDDMLVENTKVIYLGNIMSDLYATENSGRLALLSYDKKAAAKYHSQLDSLILSIENLKNENIQDVNVKAKLDTIVQILHLKSSTFDQVLDVQSKYLNFDIYNEAKSQIQSVYKKTEHQTVKIDTVVEKTNFFGRIKDAFVNKDQEKKASIESQNDKIIQQQKVIQQQNNEKINKATETIFSNVKKNELNLLKKYYDKEKLLINRNQELSNRLRDLLAEVEKIVLETSNKKYEVSKKTFDKISQNIAILGIVISVIALIFGFIILRDLNKSARNKQKLEQLNHDMEDLMKQKSFFMATISHDMVSPINSLLGFSSLLQNTIKTAKQSEYLKNIIQSTRYIKKMVDDLSLFSNLEYNKIKIKNGKFNFKELLKSIENSLKNSASKKNIRLTFEIDNKLNANFNSDAFRIQQILTNVLSNAIKFTHKGEVKLVAIFENNEVKIKISDTGIGIKIDKKDDLFVEFTQAHNNNEDYGGSGLGLNITKRLVELLNGKISYESELQKGTTFYINIPLTAVKGVATNDVGKGFEYDNAKKLENKKILVIDDDPLQLKLIEEIFSNKVKKLTTLENGQFAKDILQQEQYQIIITDMQMPFYSGLKVIQDIRSLENYKNTPVIALTGKIDFDEQEYKKLGFSFYMQKPFDIDTLYNIIYKLLRIKIADSTRTEITKKIDMKLNYTNFDLTDLFNLLDNDKDAINLILNSFFESSVNDVSALNNAYTSNDLQAIKQTAHKMLPMFRQLKINEIVDHLIVLEQKTSQIDMEDIKKVIDLISDKTPTVHEEIKNAVSNFNGK